MKIHNQVDLQYRDRISVKEDIPLFDAAVAKARELFQRGTLDSTDIGMVWSVVCGYADNSEYVENVILAACEEK